MGNATSDEHIELFGQLFATLAQGLMQNLSIEELGLTPQQIMTLIMVYSHPGITMSKLAELMGTTAPQLTRTIAALEAQNFVERIHNPENRRQVLVMRTKAGDAVAEAHMRKVQGRINARLAGLSATDHVKLNDAMQTAIHLFAKVGIVRMDPTEHD
ncbi:MarR family winged helix-turn-helix transcriptional regulator [Lacticaseibacillus porcinae]|uniref:MarR family winged helix-turn-helix transcriptional regulator n=1 Tax=Lacticaseibacillus porcinae TaxID=1123687 RepID=UPI000F790373|nr:MarR family transcriptional regulator [Lacticaseibacillus porcinae]